ncbi:MAG: deoxynucleoside kinase [Thermoanaerobaculia bacterium]
MGAPTPQQFPLRHIAVEGPIGVGKTSLVELLARRFSGTQVLEDVSNPFLSDFYAGKKGAAFKAQMFFLLSRYQQQQEIAQIDLFKNLVIADYTFAKDKVFANLTLNDAEMVIYDKMYTALAESVPRPDLVVHLTASVETCLSRIKKRGRTYERAIAPDYLKSLAEAYNYFFYHYRESPLLVVETNEIDFVARKGDLEDLIQQITRPFRGTQIYVPRGSGK